MHLWHRHGARYPTGGSPPSAFAAKLHKAVATGTGFTAIKDLQFLNTWTYKLGTYPGSNLRLLLTKTDCKGEEVLTPFGRQQVKFLLILWIFPFDHLSQLYDLGVGFRCVNRNQLPPTAFMLLPTSGSNMALSSRNLRLYQFFVPHPKTSVSRFSVNDFL